MGYMKTSEWRHAYQRLKRDAVGSVCSVLIFVASTVDALCALKILLHMLKSDFIPFKVVPVAGYDDLAAANELFIQGRDDIRTIFLLDCGGTVDLAELLSLTVHTTVFVIDSHRPYSLHNIFQNRQLKIVDDGFISANEKHLAEAFEVLENVNDEASEDATIEVADEQSENEDPNIDHRAPTHRRSQKSTEARKKLADYYRGSWYGTSVARLLFNLADDLEKTSNDHFWFAIVAVTAQYVTEHIDQESYDAEVSEFKTLQSRFNGSLEDNQPDAANKDLNRDGRIRYEQELRFMLTRHWTLFHSMLHSHYVATRLGVWREKGRRRMETLLAKMGIPLSQCHTDYLSMDTELRSALPAQLSRYAHEYGLEKACFSSFVREFGYLAKFSASDVAYSLMALLEAPYSLSRPNETGLAALPPSSDVDPKPSDQTYWIKNFYLAFDALDYGNLNLLQMGIQHAMKQHQIVLREATTLLTHRAIRYGRRFRYAILRHSPDLDWLSNALALAKLSLFLGSKKGNLPLVLASFNPSRSTYVVVATHGSDNETGEPAKNRFGISFRQAAQQTRARVKHDGFETAVIEIKSDDLKGFLQSLQRHA